MFRTLYRRNTIFRPPIPPEKRDPRTQSSSRAPSGCSVGGRGAGAGHKGGAGDGFDVLGGGICANGYQRARLDMRTTKRVSDFAVI